MASLTAASPYASIPSQYLTPSDINNISFIDIFLQSLVSLYIFSASAILLLLSLHHVREAVSRRLWLFPSHPSNLFAVNAGTLALLSIASKSTNDTSSQGAANSEYSNLLGSVLMCTLLGACMPSMPTAELKDMWSNVAGVTLLVITAVVNIYLQLTYHIIVNLAFEHITVVIVLGMLLLVLWIQALGLEAMVSDMKAMVSDQLDALRTEVRPGYSIGVVQEKPWTWDAVEQESRIKLMMVLTSNPQNVLARSSSAAVVGALVLFSLFMLWRGHWKAWLQTAGSVYDALVYVFNPVGMGGILQIATIVICGFICILRWLQVACHKKRPFFPHLPDAVPLYSHQKLSKLRRKLEAGRQTRPYVLQEGQYGLREVLQYAADFLLLLTVAPIHWMLVATIWFLHTISALLLQFLMWPLKLASSHIMCWHSNRELTMPSDLIGVMFSAGEDASIVHAKFFKAAKFVAQKQIKRAISAKADMTGLTAFLRASVSSNDWSFKSSNIFHALDQRGAPDVHNLHVKHGYQYGWRLTLFSLLAVLTKIEMEMLERSDTLEACMNACWQAREMVEVVDEQYTPIVCSKETYLSACALMWSKLLKKKHRWLQKENCVSPYVKDPEGVLKALLWPAKSHIRQFDEKKRNSNVAAFWPVQTVMHYTMHSLCQNLLNWWIDLKTCTSINAQGDGGVNAEILVKYVRFIYGDILAGCLSNLPIAVNKCTTDAVRDGQTHVVENGIFLVAQGKQLWEKLQWPPPCAPVNTFGQLCQWF